MTRQEPCSLPMFGGIFGWYLSGGIACGVAALANLTHITFQQGGPGNDPSPALVPFQPSWRRNGKDSAIQTANSFCGYHVNLHFHHIVPGCYQRSQVFNIHIVLQKFCVGLVGEGGHDSSKAEASAPTESPHASASPVASQGRRLSCR